MNKNHKDQTQFSPEKKDCRKRKPTRKQIYSFNEMQGPGLHIIKYNNIYIR